MACNHADFLGMCWPYPYETYSACMLSNGLTDAGNEGSSVDGGADAYGPTVGNPIADGDVGSPPSSGGAAGRVSVEGGAGGFAFGGGGGRGGGTTDGSINLEQSGCAMTSAVCR
jgi:hypothetical protein